MPAISKEFSETGKLSDATYKSLEEKGLNRNAVDSYIAGLTAQSQAQRAELVKVVGSEDKLKTLYEWAGANLSDKELDYYNSAVTSGNVDAAKLALHGMISRYNDAAGTEPSLVRGENNRGTNSVKPFDSQEQVTKAMSSQEYKTDPAFRKEVADRLAVSKLFSIRSS
jgi:uncharacterized protein (DUF1330 family)